MADLDLQLDWKAGVWWVPVLGSGWFYGGVLVTLGPERSGVAPEPRKVHPFRRLHLCPLCSPPWSSIQTPS